MQTSYKQRLCVAPLDPRTGYGTWDTELLDIYWEVFWVNEWMNEWVLFYLKGMCSMQMLIQKTFWKVCPITKQLLIQCFVIVPLNMSISTLGVLFLKDVKVAVVHLRSALGRWLFGSEGQKCTQATVTKDCYVGRTQENLTEPYS